MNGRRKVQNGGNWPHEVKADIGLPAPNTRRWVPRRKAQVVAAVDDGVLTVEEACERYNLTKEEFESWQKLVRKHGAKGLRVTKLQRYQQRTLRRGAHYG